MIYIDVTSAARSSMSTGVQRVVRGLYQEWSRHEFVTPICWDEKRGKYAKLSPTQLQLLTQPFEFCAKAQAHPERYGRVGWWEYLQHAFSNPWVKAEDFTAADTLFVPEIFQDGRCDLIGKKYLKCKTAGIFYDMITFLHPEWSTPKRLARFSSYLDALNKVDELFCISEYSKRTLADYFQSKGMDKVGMREEYLPTDFGERPPFKSVERKNPRILFVATFEPRKNHLNLLEACSRLWKRGLQFKLVLVGRTLGNASRAIEESVEHAMEQKFDVEWLKHVDDETLANEYEKAFFTVYPSFVEGFGLPVLESLWHYRPCLCGTGGALSEIANGGGCVTVDVSQSEALADGMRNLLTDGNLFEKLEQEARARAFRSWPDYVEAIRNKLFKSN